MSVIQGVKVVQFSQPFKETTPLQHTSSMLQEFGAQVTTIEYMVPYHPLFEGKRDPEKLTLNLKNKKIRDFVLHQVLPRVDMLVESYRPGVMERFGLDPETVHKVNPKLIYVRVSGYGHSNSDSPLIHRAGRDINYLAQSGILSKFRRNEKVGAPVFPGNILSYYASGSHYIFTQILQSFHERRPHTVIDCSLTKMLAYTSAPILLDAHLNHNGAKGFKPQNQTFPQHSVYKLQDGTNFLFKPEGPLAKKL